MRHPVLGLPSMLNQGGRLSQLLPPLQIYLHGGNAIIISHPELRWFSTSSCRCFPGLSDARKSQLQASCPLAVKASLTIPLNSQATNTFISPPYDSQTHTSLSPQINNTFLAGYRPGSLPPNTTDMV